MIKTTDIPKPLRPIVQHGVELRQGGGSNWTGDCPFCGKAKHFFASPKTGQWDCKVCGKAGNPYTFLTLMTERYSAAMTPPRRVRIAKHRRLPPAIIKDMEIGYDEETGNYMLPCRSESGTVRDIRRYSLAKKKLMSTSGCESQLWGVAALAGAKQGTRVWRCEGEWDGAAMRWLLKLCGNTSDIVVAVPGATVMKKEWPEKFAGMRVMDVGDNDDAGDQGQAKTFHQIKPYAQETKFIHWPESRPSGYDVRDFVCDGIEAGEDPKALLAQIEELMFDEPRRKPEGKKGTVDESWRPPEGMPELRDMELDEVVKTFRDSIYMTDEMELILKVMLAVAMSNDVRSDPIWLYIVGPPGAGKTLLLAAFQGTQRCLFRSTLTPASLVSGWKSDGGDPSLIPKLNGKTLVAKDFTEILDMPSLMQDEIFSTLRGAFDGHVQKSFGNGINREYKDCYFSILAGVTHAIHGHRKAHLGERFLRMEMRSLPEDHMNAVLKAAIESIGNERDVELKLQHAVACFLQRKIDKPVPMGQKVKRKIQSLVKLVAILRSQVERDPRTGDVSYRPKAELGTRLAKQLAKLGSCLAFVLGKDEVDDEVYSVMHRVALDTVGGYSFDIVEAIIKMGGRATRSDVAEKIKASGATLYRRFDDLSITGVIAKDSSAEPGPKGGKPPAEYVVSREVFSLWDESKNGESKWKTEPQPSSRGSTSSRSSTSTSASRSEQASRTSSSSSSSRRSRRLRISRR